MTVHSFARSKLPRQNMMNDVRYFHAHVGTNNGSSETETCCLSNRFIVHFSPTLDSGSDQANPRIQEGMQLEGKHEQRDLLQHRVVNLTAPCSTGHPKHVVHAMMVERERTLLKQC